MSHWKRLVLFVAVCALLQATGAGAKDPVERPFRGKATMTWVIDILTGDGQGTEQGVATHLGRYVNVASARWNLDPASFGILWGEGVATAADGDQATWIMTEDQPGVVQVTGGTGRFKNASGSFAAVSQTIVAYQEDWTTMTITITISYIAEGTLSY